MTGDVVKLFPGKAMAAPAEPPPAADYPPDRALIETLEHYLAEAKRGTLRGVAAALLWRDATGQTMGSTQWVGEAGKERFVTAGIIRALDHRFAARLLK